MFLSAEFYRKYTEWCKQNGETPCNNSTFGNTISNHIDKKNGNYTKYFINKIKI